MKFEDKNANFWKWGIEIALGCFILVIGWSTYHLSPSLFVIAVAICAAEFLVTIVFTVFTTVPQTERRHRAWCCIGIVAASLAFNAIIHATLSRRYDIAEQNKKAKQVEKRENLQLKQIESDLEIKKNESTILLEEQKGRNLQLQNQQLGMIQRGYRRPISTLLTPPTTIPTITITPVSESTYETEETKKQTEIPVILSPEQVQESAFGWVIAGIVLAISAVIGTGIGFIRVLIKTTPESETLENESPSLAPSRAQIRTHHGSANFTGEAPYERLPESHREPLFDVSREARRERLPRNEHWMDFHRVGEWDMPPIENCKWKFNSSQRSVELYDQVNRTESGDPTYLGRFGVSAQEVWKSLDETERVALIKEEAKKWKQKWKQKKGVA